MPPYETYKDVPIFVFQDDDMAEHEYGAHIEWYGRLVDIQVEDWEKPTLENIVKAAHGVIDLMKVMEEKGAVGNDGYLRPDWEPEAE